MTPQAAFGETLRQHRERRKVTLLSIAEETKISRRLLQSLEEGDCSRWPGGIYSRAYVRSYARAIGLDPEELVAEFADLFPELAWAGGRAGQDPGETAGGVEPSRGDRLPFGRSARTTA